MRLTKILAILTLIFLCIGYYCAFRELWVSFGFKAETAVIPFILVLIATIKELAQWTRP